MRAASPLDTVVTEFVDTIAPTLEAVISGLSSATPGRAHHDVVLEAYNLTCAFIDLDGLATDDELWALIDTFSPRLDTPLLRAEPSDVRHAGLTAGTSSFLTTTSIMFDILCGVDARDSSRHATRYCERAIAIAHTVASLDLHTSHTELVGIERYRGMLLDSIKSAVTSGTPPPGTDDMAEEEPFAPRPIDDLLEELDALVGLQGVKDEVKLVSNLIKVETLRRERGLPVLEHSRHLVFTGNPGTGKTTVARLLAQIYRTLGVVARGHLVETDRAALVAGFVGQTATKVTEVFDSADEGVLLIDEAYALVRGSEQDFGREAIDSIVKLVEDRRDRIVVIVAGYPEEMSTFVDSNPGLRSRFPKTIHFPDYDTDELVRIFESLCSRHHYRANDDALAAVRGWLDAQPRHKGFGNGRLARNLFEAAVARQATRIVEIEGLGDDALVTILGDDIPPVGEGPTA
jgi:hypothetical protein